MNYMYYLNKLITGLRTKLYHACLRCAENISSRFSIKMSKMEYIGHRNYFPMDHTFQKKGAYD